MNPASQSAGPSIDVELDPRVLARQFAGLQLVGGTLQPTRSGTTYPLYSPSTLEKITDVASGEAADVDHAAAVAAEAQKRWAKLPPTERGRLVARAAAVLEAHYEEIGRLVALESGKALRTEARGEAAVAAMVFQFYAGLASEIKGETAPLRPDVLAMTKREPVGVVAAIVPWNAPLVLMSAKAAPALVAGNAVIVKAAEEAPLGVLRVVQLLNQVLPPGILNVLCGDGPTTGAPLVAHPVVRKVTFTGSVETGRHIMRNAADKLIPVTLELGGKSPMIVMPDADLEQAVEGAVSGMRFTRQGQSCSASSRIFVHDSLLSRFVARMRERVDAMKIGDPLDEQTDIGTLISRDQFEKVTGYIKLGQALPGVEAITCSQLPKDEHLQRGYYVRPMLFVGVGNDSRLAQEEIFGPVACIIPFKTYEEAIAQANDTDYGLVASIFTRDLDTALDAADRLEAGLVQINQHAVSPVGVPYGGFKDSGLGKEFSRAAMLDHFTREKTILIKSKR